MTPVTKTDVPIGTGEWENRPKRRLPIGSACRFVPASLISSRRRMACGLSGTSQSGFAHLWLC